MGALGGVTFILLAIFLVTLGVTGRFTATWQAITGAATSGSGTATSAGGAVASAVSGVANAASNAAVSGAGLLGTAATGVVAGTVDSIDNEASATYQDSQGGVVTVAPVSVSVPTIPVGSNQGLTYGPMVGAGGG